jgi:16S rRNA (uracil1498-N3)-methyltransferase
VIGGVGRPVAGRTQPASVADMADRFYLNSPLAPGEVVLSGPEAHHLATVLRARPGDAVCLFNGDGAEYPAVVTAVVKKRVVVRVEGRLTPDREVGHRLEVAAPLPKGDRGDFLIEKLTELGATHYVPLRTRRSVVHPREAKLERLERAVIEASKQCGRNVLLRIEPPADWEEYGRRPTLPARRWLAHFGGGAWAGQATGDVALAVGPEGGFTDEEVERARAAGWGIVCLGPRVLRVETAALALAMLAQ